MGYFEVVANWWNTALPFPKFMMCVYVLGPFLFMGIVAWTEREKKF